MPASNVGGAPPVNAVVALSTKNVIDDDDDDGSTLACLSGVATLKPVRVPLKSVTAPIDGAVPGYN